MTAFSVIWNDLKNLHLESDKYIVLEDRPKKYLFGTNNYGEIIGTLNKADGDPWDIIVPGYDKLKRYTNIKIKKLEGIILMPNGNHKIVIDVFTDASRRSFSDIKNEIYTYRRLYNKICRKRGEVILL